MERFNLLVDGNKYTKDQCWRHWLAWWCAIVCALWLVRYDTEVSVAFELFGLRGYVSDVVMAWFIAGFLMLIPSMAITSLVLLLMGVAISGNAQHIDVNANHAQLMMWEYAANTTFIEGSLLTLATMISASLYWCVTICVYFAVRALLYWYQGRCGWYILWTAMAAFTLALLVHPVQDSEPQWLQTSVAESNLTAWWEADLGDVPDAWQDDIPKRLAQFYTRDLSGKHIIPNLQDKKPNVFNDYSGIAKRCACEGFYAKLEKDAVSGVIL